MAELKGEFIRRGERFSVRVTIKGRTRKVFPLSPKSEDAALERARLVCDMAAELRRAKLAHSRDGLKLLELAAVGNPRTARGAQSAARALIAGDLEDATDCPTFAELAADWTSGKLHKDYPDYVKAKDSTADELRLKVVCAVDLGGVTFGELPIDQIRVEHCDAVMRSLPATSKRPGSRRHYGQVMSRVLSLAASPLRLIDKNPLPKGFLPQVGKPPAYHYLYPEDDRMLLGCAEVPLGRRVYWGWVAREGGRKGETARLQVKDFDLVRGVVRIDENKTDDPRSWAMTPGVTEALSAWVELQRLKPRDLMFQNEGGQGFVDDDHMARLLRRDLRTAGLGERRPELFESTPSRSKMRMHDLRGTFVTLSLAAGKSETWVADRTGHTSSVMIHRYRRRAREASELSLGELDRLDLAIPEFRSGSADCPPFAHERSSIAASPVASSEESSMISMVPKEGLEPPRPSRAMDFESVEGSGKDAGSCDSADLDDAERRGATSRGQAVGKTDPVEAALADALSLAAKSSQWDVVARLADELKARRNARAGVVDLASVRRGKGDH